MSTIYVIDAIPGDGMGVDVTDVAMCVDAVAEPHNFAVRRRIRDWNSDLYRKTGLIMPVGGIEQLSSGDGIHLSAVGTPDVHDDVTLWGLLSPIRREFDQYVNLQPMRLLPGVTGSMPGLEDLDIVVICEKVEGEYLQIGGGSGPARPRLRCRRACSCGPAFHG